MKRSLYTTLVFALIPALLACQSGKGETIDINDLNVPTFANDKHVTIGAWSWTTKNVNNTQLSDLKDAGINLLIGTFNNGDSADSSLLDRASEYGIDLIIDKRPWEGTIPAYADKENFKGYCVFDEPVYSDLASLKVMKQSWDASALKDKTFFVNLHPSYSGRIGTTYEQYVQAYTEELGLDMVSFDYYPLFKNMSGGVGLREDWLLNLSIAGYYARKNNVPLWFTFLTTEHNASSLSYINPTAKDMAYQMYMGMAFGCEYLIHYTYSATGIDHLNPIIDKYGNPTDSYYDAKDAGAIIRNWDSVYMNFKNIGVTPIFGKVENTGLLDYMIHDSSIDEFQTLESAKSDYDVVCGHFEDEQHNKGFVLTNITNPYDEKNAKVTLKFNPNYKGVKIYNGDKEEVKALTKNSVDLEIDSGSAIFVVPLKLK